MAGKWEIGLKQHAAIDRAYLVLRTDVMMQCNARTMYRIYLVCHLHVLLTPCRQRPYCRIHSCCNGIRLFYNLNHDAR